MKGYARAVRRILMAVLALNLAVAVAKLVAGWRAGSLAVTGDGLHSGVDALGNVVALLVLRLATAPPDEDHPYGHSKYETLAAFALSGLMLLTAFELGRSAVGQLIEPRVPSYSLVTVAVMVGTLAVNIVVSELEARAGRRLRSEILLADASQTRMDVFVTMAVLAGMMLQRAGIPRVDAFVALGVAVSIAAAAWRVFQRALPVLTDATARDPAEVRRVVESVPGVQSVHDIRSRMTGRDAYVQMHLVVEPDDVRGAHAIADEVERRVARELDVHEVFVHVEPEDDDSGPPGSRGDRAGVAVGKG